jgi:hypothetical protein
MIPVSNYNAAMAVYSHTSTDVRWTAQRVPLTDEHLDRMVLAVELVRQRLARATTALDTAGVPYAVVGGHAVAAWVSTIDPAAARNTVDVELLIPRGQLESAKAALDAAGFIHSFTSGIHMFVDGPQGKAREAVHLLFTNEPVKPNDLAESPGLNAAQRMGERTVIDLESLVRMKLTSFRDKDRTHLRDMLEVGLIDDTWLPRLPEALRPRLQELLDNPDG